MRATTVCLRGLWLAVILLTGLVTAVLTGAAFWLAGAGVAAALAAAGATFLGTSTFGIAIHRFLSEGAA